MQIVEGVKDLRESIRLLRKISKKREYSISSPDFKGCKKAIIRKASKGFNFSIEHDDALFEHDEWRFNKVCFEDTELRFMANSIFPTKKSIGLVTGKVGNILSEDFDAKRITYQRLVIPISSKINFVFSVENVIIEYIHDGKSTSRNATKVDFGNADFLIYQVTKDSNNLVRNNHLVVESSQALDFEEFHQKCYSILIAFGYVSGLFIQNEGFFFQYDSPEMEMPYSFHHTVFRDSIKCSYVPVYSNSYGYIHDNKVAETYYQRLKPLSLKEFSTLCAKTNKLDDFKSILLLILESNKQSLVSGPGMLSIALESFSNLIYRENEKILAPISKKGLAKKVRDALQKELLKFSNDIGEEGTEILKRKIEQINQRTNRDRLLLPFKILNIRLNEKDKNAIDQRNSFLHGKTPTMLSETPTDLHQADRLRYYLYLKLYSLVSALILRYCGFDGLILNFAKIYESNTGVPLDEGHYRSFNQL